MHKNSVPMEKEVNLSCKNGEEITKTISYRLQFTDAQDYQRKKTFTVT